MRLEAMKIQALHKRGNNFFPRQICTLQSSSISTIAGFFLFSSNASSMIVEAFGEFCNITSIFTYPVRGKLNLSITYTYSIKAMANNDSP